MKNIRLFILVVGPVIWSAGRSFAQTVGFVQQETIKVAGITADSMIYPLSLMQKQTTRVYYDGQGRTIQTVGVKSSPLQNDLIQPVAYDNLGRQTTGYLAYAGQSADITGSYRTNALTGAQAAFYNNGSQYMVAKDSSPYTQQVFENSPLQRMLLAGTVGKGFQPVTGGHYKTVIYRTNKSSTDGNILVWNVDGSFTSGNYYADNTLSVTDAKDEDNTETLVFKDYLGNAVLKRQLLSGANIDTYYIYNNAGLPAWIIPPKALALMVANSNYSLTQTGVSNLIFSFAYDNRARLTIKTVPSKGAMYMVYDPVNRPVLVQDAHMRLANQWNYIKYDAKGRVISQGIYTDATHTTLSAMQSYVNGLNYGSTWYESRSATLTNNGYYTNAIFPSTNVTPLAYAYYDNYDLNLDGAPDFSYTAQGLTNEETATTAQLKGVATMVFQTTIGSGLSNTWLGKVTFYDKRGHAIQTQSNNQVYYTSATAVTDYATAVPDFVGMPQSTQVSKKTSSTTTTTVKTTLAYDHMYRVTSVSQQYNGGSQRLVAAYTYNEMGQVIQKNLGQPGSGSAPANLTLNSQTSGTYIAANSITLSPTGSGFSTAPGATFSASIVSTYLQTVDYRYNIRGQLLSINNSKLSNDGGVTNNDNNDVFGMQLLYDQTDGNLGNTAYYNGKVSAVKWMSKDANGNSSWERAYKYSYDALGRDTASHYAERATTGTGSFNNNLGGFDEFGISYDVGGNLQTLKRNSSTQGTNSHVEVDNLAYTYNSANPNQLVSVSDVNDANHNGYGFMVYAGGNRSGTYSYDVNGNLTNDPYKSLALTYNVLNRTDTIKFTANTGRYITYTYNASGSLIRKKQYDSNTLQTTTDYVDGFVYINATLSYLPMPEGRLLNNAGTLTQEFIITDQQGNARVSFQDNGSGVAVVKQETSYYAFGLQLANSPVALPTVANKQLYNGGSEWQNDFSNLPDYQQTFFRNYDAALGRWIAVDPEAESAESITGYQYSGNNPVMFNDPLGNKAMTAAQAEMASQPTVGGGGGPDPLDKWVDGLKDAYEYQNALFGGVTEEDKNNQYVAQLARQIAGLQSGQTSIFVESMIYTGLRPNAAKLRSGDAQLRYGNGQIKVEWQDDYFDKSNGDVVIKVHSFTISVPQFGGGAASQGGQLNGFNSKMGFDWLNSNAAASWEGANGACAKYIRRYLENGFGLKEDAFKGKAPVPARLYGTFLTGLGYKAVNTNNYQMGDITVFNGIPGSKADPKTGILYGHIQVFDGNIWISDFKQDRPFWPSGKYQSYGPSYQIYRLGN